MGRSAKITLDWFPLACDALNDPKLRRPRQEFGYLAIVVYLELLCILYRDKGYYIEYNENTRDDVIWTITNDVLSGKYQPDNDTIRRVIDRLAACRLFSHDLYQRGFITSHRAQEQYYRGMIGRVSSRVDYSIWLLDETEMNEISSDNPILRNFVSGRETSISRPEMPVSRPESAHRKREDRREEKRIEDNTITEDTSGASVVEAKFQECFGVPVDIGLHSVIRKLLADGRCADDLLDAVETAAKNHARRPKENIYAYVCGTLKQYRPKPQTAAPEPSAAVKDWEQEYFDEVRRYQEQKWDEGCEKQEGIQK